MKENSMFDSLLERPQKPSGPVTCLGMTFENDEARRAHFTEELRKKLQDPEFRKIEGFPIGSDEDILNLSDPPYYTACPNPWIADFIAEWEAQKPEQPEGYHYHREPFAADVSVARHDHYTLAHTYHTKVSPLAISQYIEHFTTPGDIVLDMFAGSGMTGLAGAGSPLKCNKLTSQSPRKIILGDLGVGATHIAYGNSAKFSINEIAAVRTKLSQIANKFSYYKTISGGCNSRIDAWEGKTDRGSDRLKDGNIEYVVWSEILLCPSCDKEIIFSDKAFDQAAKTVHDEFKCDNCGKDLNKRSCKRKIESFYDHLLGEVKSRIALVPVFTAFRAGKKRFYRRPVAEDVAIPDLNNFSIPTPMPIMKGERFYKDALTEIYKISHVHHFYTERNVAAISELISGCKDLSARQASLMRFLLTSIAVKASKLMNYNADGVGRVMKGTLYASSLVQECNPFWLAEVSLRDIERLCLACHHDHKDVVITTQSASSFSERDVVDYIWIDPPFGKNLMYAELNQLWEWWLKNKTAESEEAVIDEKRNKSIFDYTNKMHECFLAAYHILKPGRWITIEFHNSKNAVWNAIQEALTKAGFVVADVRMLDKKLMTYKQSQQGLVKVDLIISAYKPNGGLEDRFKLVAGTEEGVWDFIRSHLSNLPVFADKDGVLEVIQERKDYLLYDRMLAFHVQRGVLVPMSSAEFYGGLAQRFSERDGMYFLPQQSSVYDRKRLKAQGIEPLRLFVYDEASARQWLKELIAVKPQGIQDIQPQFLKEIAGWRQTESRIELSILLEQNFLRYDGKGPVPEQIHAYLSSNWKELRSLPKDDPTLVAKARDRWFVPDPNKAGDLEKLREKALLKEFEEYKEAKKKLKVFRLEAVRAGFKKAWQERDYAVIIAVADKIPNNVLEEDPKLLMWYDQAVTRMGGE